ncbi:cupin domain-containing protein [Fundidesulfovibrio agrisoli]|uniref:cupin domain-containing protein n=1 Tax=Fundidesulfovibrio agrisoli TaxID=2922717 RepID=UPI001FACE29E|nr:cupin domain-containing protein [Fundidesulfovibrio agrisoli]
MAKCIITEADILQAAATGQKILAAPDCECIVTDQARERALELGVALPGECDARAPAASAAQAAAPGVGEASSGAGTAPLVSQLVRAVCAKLPPGSDPAEVERLVRGAVAARMPSHPGGAGGAAAAEPAEQGAATLCEGGVRYIEAARLLRQGGKAADVPGQALLAEALGSPGEAALAAGYLAWERASFSREVDAAELGVVIEGELHLTVGGRTIIGKPGDMVYLPKGAKVLYSTPSRVMMACVNAH